MVDALTNYRVEFNFPRAELSQWLLTGEEVRQIK